MWRYDKSVFRTSKSRIKMVIICSLSLGIILGCFRLCFNEFSLWYELVNQRQSGLHVTLLGRSHREEFSVLRTIVMTFANFYVLSSEVLKVNEFRLFSLDHEDSYGRALNYRTPASVCNDILLEFNGILEITSLFGTYDKRLPDSINIYLQNGSSL